MPKEVGTLSIGEKYRNFKEIMNQTLFEDSRGDEAGWTEEDDGVEHA
jgi:hypothetical protein